MHVQSASIRVLRCMRSWHCYVQHTLIKEGRHASITVCVESSTCWATWCKQERECEGVGTGVAMCRMLLHGPKFSLLNHSFHILQSPDNEAALISVHAKCRGLLKSTLPYTSVRVQWIQYSWVVT